MKQMRKMERKLPNMGGMGNPFGGGNPFEALIPLGAEVFRD